MKWGEGPTTANIMFMPAAGDVLILSLVFIFRLVTWDRTKLRKPSHVSYSKVVRNATGRKLVLRKLALLLATQTHATSKQVKEARVPTFKKFYPKLKEVKDKLSV